MSNSHSPLILSLVFRDGGITFDMTFEGNAKYFSGSSTIMKDIAQSLTEHFKDKMIEKGLATQSSNVKMQ